MPLSTNAELDSNASDSREVDYQRLTTLLKEVNTFTHTFPIPALETISVEEVMNLIRRLLENERITYDYFLIYQSSIDWLAKKLRESDNRNDGLLVAKIRASNNITKYTRESKGPLSVRYLEYWFSEIICCEIKNRKPISIDFDIWQKENLEPYLIHLVHYYTSFEIEKKEELYYAMVDAIKTKSTSQIFSEEFIGYIKEKFDQYRFPVDLKARILSLFLVPVRSIYDQFISPHLNFLEAALKDKRFPSQPIRFMGSRVDATTQMIKVDTLYELTPVQVMRLVLEEVDMVLNNMKTSDKPIPEQLESVCAAGYLAMRDCTAGSERYQVGSESRMSPEETKRLLTLCFNLQTFNRESINMDPRRTELSCHFPDEIIVPEIFARMYQLKSAKYNISSMKSAFFKAMKSGQIALESEEEEVYQLKS